MVASGKNHEQIQVLVADSGHIQSELLCGALRRQPGMTVRSCGSQLIHCLEALQTASTDVLVLSDDPSVPDHQIDTLRALHSRYPSVRLILSVDKYDRNLVVEALDAGTRGLFRRADQTFRALCRCITVVNRGEFWVSSEQLEYVVEALRMGVPHRVINSKNIGLLTPREEQVVNLVAGGISNRAVAQQLGVKENTIKKSLLRVYDKLGVSNRIELVLHTLSHQKVSEFPGGWTKSATPSRKGLLSVEGTHSRPSKDSPYNPQ